MAVVFLARDLKHDRQVAVKVLRPEISESLGPERFLGEIRVAARLTHPNIIPVHDSGEADGLLYYVMPFVAGESLQQRLHREGRLPMAAALRVVTEVADALDYAHAQGIVHRDVKPENILLEAGHAIVADFGIARAISAAGGRRTTAGVVVGTPEYMSPEQATADASVDARADVYSLGCVAYEMLAGRPPFTGTARAVIAAQVAQPSTPLSDALPDVPAHVAAAVTRALDKDPARRFASAGAFAAALERRSGTGWTARRRSVAWVATAVTVAALVLGLWVFRDAREAPAAFAADPSHVAVLYFDDLSADHSLGPTAAGLTEDLIDALAAVPALSVVSPNGVHPYAGTPTPPESLARALRVGTLIAGSVTRSGDRLRVSARLIDGRDGRQLASVALPDRPIAELFRLQDSLTSALADALRGQLGQAVTVRAQRAGTRDVHAWDLVRHADALVEDSRSLLALGDDRSAAERLHAADSVFALATSADRGWAEPLLGRSRVALNLAVLGLGGSGGIDVFAGQVGAGLRYAQQALQLPGGAPAALEQRGILRYRLWQFGSGARDTLLTRAESDLRAAVDSDPTRARAWAVLSDLFVTTGRFAESEQAGRRALAADAYLNEARTVITNLFTATLHRGHFSEAQQWCDRGRMRYPADPNFVDCALRVLGWSARGDRAVDSAWRLVASGDRGDSVGALPASRWERRLLAGMVLARSGDRDSARAVVRRTSAGVPDSSWAALRADEAYIDILAGNGDEALRQLASFLKWFPESKAYVAQSPWFRQLQPDPRFQGLVAQRSQ